MDDFFQRFAQVDGHSLWIEFAALVASVAVAWGVGRWFWRGRPKESIWFTRRVFDGLLFPVVALVLTDIMRRVLLGSQPVLMLSIAVPVFLSLVVIRLVAGVLSAVFPDHPVVRLIGRTVSWIVWLCSVLWIVGLLPVMVSELESITVGFGKTRVSLYMILQGVLSVGVVLVVTLWISAALEQRVLKHAVADLSMRKVAANAIRALLLFIGLLFALSAVGVDLTALSVLGGALGVGLGFGLQKLAANYVSGFVILLERSIRIGDHVKVDNFEGRVTDIKTRYTLVRALNGREAIVPNESLITSRVENITHVYRRFKVETNIVVGSNSDPEQVQSILCAAAAAQPRVLRDPAPVVFFVNFAADGLEFSLNFWIADPENGQLNVRSAINIAILKGLREAGIDIPSPQRVVRFASLPPKAASPLGGPL